MNLWLILAIPFAILEALAVAKSARNLEYVAKPAVMILLFLWLYTLTGLQGTAMWFGVGVLFSLAGDVFLMLPSNKLFLFGLAAFLLAHLSYIMGFREAFVWRNGGLVSIAVLILIPVSLLLRRIVQAMRSRGERKLVAPVIVYGIVISVMLYAAISTIYHPAWAPGSAFLVSAGALLFVVSDAILAWNKFVSPFPGGRVWNMAAYHLGQIGLIAGVISQFR